MNEVSPFRILALDGGGMRGIFTAAALTETEDALEHSIADDVDLLVGTSTGGIIALGLAAGFPARELLDLYCNRGREIFSRRRSIIRLMRPRYDRGPLDHVLQDKFRDMRMNDLKHDVCITAHELVEGTTRVVKNDHAGGLRWGGTRLVWQVAAATSAAPTYFAPVQLDEQDSHIDGGVWSNNPAIVGITEAVRYYERDLRQIRLLSIGTTSTTLRVPNHRRALRMGHIGWGRKVLDLLQGSVSKASHWQAKLLLPDGHYLRIDDDGAEKIRLDDVERCRPLQERGRQAARLHAAEIRSVLAID